MRQSVLNRCSNLVVLELDEHVRFTHHSVREFLTNTCPLLYGGKKSTSDPQDFYIDPHGGKLKCAEFSINYLSFSDFTLQLLKTTASVAYPTNILGPVGKTLPNSVSTFLGKMAKQWWGLDVSKTQDQMVMTSRMLPRTEKLPDANKYRYLPYAIEYWALDSRHIDKTSPVWKSFKKLACQPNTTWNFHPWKAGTAHFHGLLGWSVRHNHIPLLRLLVIDAPLERRLTDNGLKELIGKPVVEDGLPALHVAAKLGYCEVVKLLTPYCDINAVDVPKQRTALHYAVETNCERVISELINAGAVSSIPDLDGMTSLMLAVSLGQSVSIINLASASRVLASCEHHILHFAIYGEHMAWSNRLPHSDDGDVLKLNLLYQVRKQFTSAEQEARDAIVSRLLERKVDLDSRYLGLTPLGFAMLFGSSAMISMLLGSGAAENVLVPKTGDSLMHILARRLTDVEVVLARFSGRLLESMGLDSVNVAGMTPLHVCARHGSANAFDAFLNTVLYTTGSINIRDYCGMSALDIAVQRYCFYKTKQSPADSNWDSCFPPRFETGSSLDIARRYWNQQDVDSALRMSKNRLEHKDHGTLLHMAAIVRQPEAINRVLAQGIDPNIPNRVGETALHIASRNSDYESVIELLGGDGPQEAKHDHGRTPLDLAILNAKSERRYAEFRILIACVMSLYHTDPSNHGRLAAFGLDFGVEDPRGEHLQFAKDRWAYLSRGQKDRITQILMDNKQA